MRSWFLTDVAVPVATDGRANGALAAAGAAAVLVVVIYLTRHVDIETSPYSFVIAIAYGLPIIVLIVGIGIVITNPDFEKEMREDPCEYGLDPGPGRTCITVTVPR